MKWVDAVTNFLTKLLRQQPVRILSPETGIKVPYSHIVRGVAPDTTSLVQLFVQAADGQWYLQAPVVRDAKRPYRWSGYVCFGTPDGHEGNTYTLAAVIPHVPAVTSPLADLPEGSYTDFVQVVRANFDPNAPTGFDNPRPTGDGSLGDPQQR